MESGRGELVKEWRMKEREYGKEWRENEGMSRVKRREKSIRRKYKD